MIKVSPLLFDMHDEETLNELAEYILPTKPKDCESTRRLKYILRREYIKRIKEYAEQYAEAVNDINA